MFRRRKRRSSFARPSVIKPWMVMSAGGVVFVGLFVFLMRQAATHPPAQQEMHIEVPINGSN
jgi:succinate dehydrogenase hydrophobic anchor subunit